VISGSTYWYSPNFFIIW